MSRIENLLHQTAVGGEVDYVLISSLLASEGYMAPAKKIHDLMKAGTLIGVKKGLYVVASDQIPGSVCKETLANLIYGPSCISMEYALAYLGLIPERVETVTSVTPKRDKHFETPLGIFTYRYLTNDKYREGINLVWIDSRHPVLMATAEKALCDYVVLNRIWHLESTSDARLFLLEDLRIDPENLKRLDLTALHKLNRIYKNKGMDKITAFLEGLQP